MPRTYRRRQGEITRVVDEPQSGVRVLDAEPIECVLDVPLLVRPYAASAAILNLGLGLESAVVARAL